MEEGEESVRSDSYMISHPGVWVEETPETVCTKLLQENPVGANLTLRLYPEKPDYSATTGDSWLFRVSNEPARQLESRLEAGERDKCLQLSLPRSSEGTATGLLEVEIQSEDGSLDIRTFREISIFQQEIYPLIQTDKGHYKAKDQVKFRVLLLDQNLKPTEDLRTIEEIWVEDPRNRRIAQWKDVVSSKLSFLPPQPPYFQPLSQGLVQREFPLSEEPVLGQYKILVTTRGPSLKLKETASFTVSEYVLPKFEVVLLPPAAVLRDAQLTIFKVCSAENNVDRRG